MADANADAQGRFRRLQVGEIRVIALADGVQDIPTALFGDADGADKERLAREAGFGPDAIPIAVNTFAVRTGGELYLVDAGSGSSRGPHVGHMPASMAAAGLDPAEVQAVLMTHMHGDHAGGLRDASGAAMYPNAELRLADAEAAFWSDPGLPPRAPERMQPTLKNAVASFEAYRHRIARFRPGDEVAPGVTAVDLAGHTPGHTGFLIESGGERLFIWADVIHVEAFQFRHPEWTIGFDVDGQQAAATRKCTFERAASERLPIAGMHLGFPSFGHVVRRDGAFGFEPMP